MHWHCIKGTSFFSRLLNRSFQFRGTFCRRRKNVIEKFARKTGTFHCLRYILECDVIVCVRVCTTKKNQCLRTYRFSGCQMKTMKVRCMYSKWRQASAQIGAYCLLYVKKCQVLWRFKVQYVWILFFLTFCISIFFWFRFLFYSPLFFILHNLVGFTDDHLKLWRFFFRLWLFCSKCVICARVFLSLLFSKCINILTILSLILLTDWGEVTVMLCRLTHRHRHLYMLDLISNTKSEKERVMQKKAKSNTLKCLNAKL